MDSPSTPALDLLLSTTLEKFHKTFTDIVMKGIHPSKYIDQFVLIPGGVFIQHHNTYEKFGFVELTYNGRMISCKDDKIFYIDDVELEAEEIEMLRDKPLLHILNCINHKRS